MLAPGEATRWHRDPFHRVSIVLSGDALEIQFLDGSAKIEVSVSAGQVDWDEPGDRAHRAVNTGRQNYEEITVFFLSHPDDTPQPDALEFTPAQ